MNILLVDDHALFRAGLRLLLGSLRPDMSFHEASDVDQALALARDHEDLRLCLLDLDLRQDRGLPAIAQIKHIAPKLAIVIVSGTDDRMTVRSCIEAGAMSYITKSSPPDVLTHALTRVLQGDVFLPQSVLSVEPEPPPRALALTRRQQEVLAGLSRGLPTKVIARELAISENTAKEYISDILRVLEVRNRTEAVLRASRLNLNAHA